MLIDKSICNIYAQFEKFLYSFEGKANQGNDLKIQNGSSYYFCHGR